MILVQKSTDKAYKRYRMLKQKATPKGCLLERKTRLELATPTFAR